MASSSTWAGWVLLCGAAGASAEPPPETAAAESAPSMEMLLYLGEFETTEGETLDPMTLAEENATPDAEVPANQRPDRKERKHAASRR